MQTIAACVLVAVLATGCDWKASRTATWAKPKPESEHSHEEGHEHGTGPGQHTHEHDSDDVPITETDIDMPTDYPATVKRLRYYADQIKKAITSGKPSKAHRPLDEADIVIDKVMVIARDGGVPKTDWEEVNVARRALRAEFDVLHAAIDGGKQPDWRAAEPGVNAALKHLASVVKKATTKSK